MKHNIAYFYIALVAIVIFIWGANRQSVTVNTNMYEMDQSAYLEYAKKLSQTGYKYIGGRNRMPLYPALLSLFYEDSMSDEDYFERGKKVGVAIGIIGIIITYLVFSRVSNPLAAMTGTLVAVFTMFAYKAPYFQAEVLFYIIGLVLFSLLVSFVKRPKLKTAVLTGFVGGIGHLTKASVIPAILLAAFIVLTRGIIEQRSRFRQEDETSSQLRNHNPFWRVLINVAVSLLCFHLVVFPYIRTSKERFGRYYYNVNSTFYIWYDSWEEAEQGTKAHGDREGWPDMPSEDIPCLEKYLREHTFNQIIERFSRGFSGMAERVMLSYGYAEYILLYGIASVLLIVQHMKVWQQRLFQTGNIGVLFFAFGYFGGYLLLYGWYNPIAGGNRFPLSLFLPALLLFMWLLSYAQKHKMRIRILGTEISASGISVFVLLNLVVYLLIVFPNRISTMFGGS